MIDEYLISLAREYLDLIALMRSGQYDGDAYRELSAQRSATHDELIRRLGAEYARPFDMERYARELVNA